MRKKVEKILAIIIVNVIILYSVFPVAYGEDIEEAENYNIKIQESNEIIPKIHDVTIDEFNKNNKEEKEVKKTNFLQKFLMLFSSSKNEDTIPEQYDLRSSNPNNFANHGNIEINVESQGDYGLCWAFASLGAVKTHLAVKGYNNYKTLNLSEWHMNYLQSKYYDINKKLMEFLNQEGYIETSERELSGPGSIDMFYSYIMNNNGPVLEERCPYGQSIDVNDEDALRQIENIKPDFYVHKIIEFPCIMKVRQDNGTVAIYQGDISQNNIIQNEEMKTIRDRIKKTIMDNGGLYSIIRWDSKFMGNRIGEKYRNVDGEFAEYDDGTIKNSEEVHAINIIGWDDNYDKNKINAMNSKGEIVHPTSNGAYLAVNSWGEDWGENGCFWISYEDACVESRLSWNIRSRSN
ncbi:MAG: C1 family peptidase [Clostridia bacterium]|nr:C1 family peptidase [Clostridia bacterium]